IETGGGRRIVVERSEEVEAQAALVAADVGYVDGRIADGSHALVIGTDPWNGGSASRPCGRRFGSNSRRPAASRSLRATCVDEGVEGRAGAFLVAASRTRKASAARCRRNRRLHEQRAVAGERREDDVGVVLDVVEVERDPDVAVALGDDDP